MEYINKDFLLENETAKKLYHKYCEELPIIDYHCHLNPMEIAEHKKFRNITELCKFCRVDISDRSVVKLRSPAETYIFGMELVKNKALVFLSLVCGNLFTRKGFLEYCVNLVCIRFRIRDKIKSVIACTAAVSVEVFQS